MPIFFSSKTPRYAADEIAVFNPDTNEWQRKKVEVQQSEINIIICKMQEWN